MVGKVPKGLTVPSAGMIRFRFKGHRTRCIPQHLAISQPLWRDTPRQYRSVRLILPEVKPPRHGQPLRRRVARRWLPEDGT